MFLGNNIAVYLHPLPFGYSPCPGESADDDVECKRCLSLWLLAKAAAFGRRPKGSVKPTCTVPLRGGVARPLEGWLNAKPCRVRGAQYSVRRGWN